MSGKDRGAVLLAGRSRGRVYWYEPALDRFATSVHYDDDDPGWVEDFNDEARAALLADSVWALEVPETLRQLARPDSFPFEGDGVHTTFPHRFGDDPEDAEGAFGYWVATTPALDAWTLAFARRAVEAEGLGDDDHPDLLAVSLSQTDRIGHAYGPTSLEQLDNLVRLDRELGAFLDWLDGEVGVENYLVAFTSDHGVMELPEVRAADGRPGLRLTRDSVATLQAILDSVAAAVGGEGPAALARALAESVPGVPWIERAWARADLAAGPPQPDSFTRLRLQNYVADRTTGLLGRTGVEMQFSEGVVTWSYPRGAAHSSPYHYDRHVPLIFAGPGIDPEVRTEAVSMADIAPTLAALVGVEVPDDLDGVARSIR